MTRSDSSKWLVTPVGVVAVGAILVAILRPAAFGEPSVWQRQVLPGHLSTAHALLENDCASCHSAVAGVTAEKCVGCHATNERLLKRQPTAFHAHVQECSGCHLEHQGSNERITRMDHAALAVIGLRAVERDGEHGAGQGYQKLLSALRGLSPETRGVLDCSGCHSNQDHHFKLFGSDCAECHGTETWKIAGFRHPGPASRDCSECHQAPPSHYMEHFAMISMKVARVEHADVRQCYLCHQTTAWNDIRGIGWYKHH